MKRLLSILATGILAGCSGDQATGPKSGEETKTPSSVTNSTSPADIERVAVPTVTATPEAPSAVTNETTDVVNRSVTPLLPPLEQKPSDYPAALSQAINLRNQLDSIPENSTVIPQEITNELLQYTNNIKGLVQSNYDKLDKEKRTLLEEFSEKLAYQIEKAQSRSTSATVTNLKASLGYIHQGLSTD